MKSAKGTVVWGLAITALVAGDTGCASLGAQGGSSSAERALSGTWTCDFDEFDASQGNTYSNETLVTQAGGTTLLVNASAPYDLGYWFCQPFTVSGGAAEASSSFTCPTSDSSDPTVTVYSAIVEASADGEMLSLYAEATDATGDSMQLFGTCLNAAAPDAGTGGIGSGS